MDPLAEKYYYWSPYAYCANNPLRYIDLTGMSYGAFYDQGGTYLGTDGVDDGKVYILDKGKRARTENINVNWGGTLAENHVDQLKSNSSEVSMDSDLGNMMRAVYAEMKSGNEKADGTYTGIVNKFYDVSK